MGRGARRSGATTLIYDSFADSDGTSLHAHAPDYNAPGGSWSETDISGTPDFDIQSNQAHYGAAANAMGFAAIPTGVANFIISCLVRTDPLNDSTPGLVLRASDAANLWFVTINTASDLFAIVEVNNSTQTTRASASVPLGLDEAHTVLVAASGPNILARLDGKNEISYNAAALNQATAAAGIGQARAGARNCYFAEFRVMEL